MLKNVMTAFGIEKAKTGSCQFLYDCPCRQNRQNAHTTERGYLVFIRTIPLLVALAIIRASITPSMASAIIRFASIRFLPQDTAPLSAGASAVYPPISFSD